MDSIDPARITVRNLHIDEYDILIRIWDTAGLPSKPKGRDSREHIAREIQEGSGFFLVAELGGKIIGSVFGTSDGRKGWINRLAVLPEYQRQGIGHVLVREAEKRLYDAGIEIIACLIENWNAVSLQAFERMGYVRHDDIIYFTKRRSPDV
ncbi:MAG: GNAT family N-acetyltransferase [candidate division WOR-3 bacterium]|nr:MAG: GNAT family N-acetyltransferase [candidate division WOR-3 bacterium]